MTTGVTERLEEIFRAVFELPPGSEITHLQQGSPKWDSLGHVKLVAALESEFGLEIDTADALRLNSYAATRQWLQSQEIL